MSGIGVFGERVISIVWSEWYNHGILGISVIDRVE